MIGRLVAVGGGGGCCGGGGGGLQRELGWEKGA